MDDSLKLKKKLKYFFDFRYRKRSDIREPLSKIENLGDLVLIGGTIRDIALLGNAGFGSDLDFVINPKDLEEFEHSMLVMGARKNRFGGYSLPPNRWQIDVWPLQKTWAHLEGYVSVKSFEDLVNVTFFDCDAIIYATKDRTLYFSSDYFSRLNERLLDINLMHTPNPTGNVVRAFRYALLKDFSWGRKLANFVAERIETVGWVALEDKEKQSFRSDYIASFLDKPRFEHHLQHFISTLGQTRFEPAKFRKPVQLPLPF